MHPYPVPPHRCIILSIGPIPASPLADASYHFTHLHLQSAPRNRPQAQIHLAPSMNSTSTLRFLVFPTLSHLFMTAFKYLLAGAGKSVKVASSKKMGELLPVLPKPVVVGSLRRTSNNMCSAPIMCWQAILIAALLCIGFALHYQLKSTDPETKTVMARVSSNLDNLGNAQKLNASSLVH